MPRLIDDKQCPHCATDLPELKPRVCPSCGGSLQQRYLKSGCITSAPTLLLLVLTAWIALHALA